MYFGATDLKQTRNFKHNLGISIEKRDALAAAKSAKKGSESNVWTKSHFSNFRVE